MVAIDIEAKGISPQVAASLVLWMRRDIDTTPMHIIKLVYLAHGWMLGFDQRPLINEMVEAWRYGPVIPSLYHRYKGYKIIPKVLLPSVKVLEQANEQQIEIIRVVNNAYLEFTAFQLSALTHLPGSPWDTVWDENGYVCIIPNDLIQEYYENIITDRKKGILADE